MPNLMQAFDATQYDPSQGASQLPLGKHPVIIESSSVETTKDGSSGMVVLTLRIIDGPNKGASGAYRLNLYNQSAKASEIAHRQLSALCHVTGQFRITKTDDLHNIPFVVEVGLQREPDNAAKGYTEVQRVYDMNGNEPGKQGQAGGMAQPQQQQPMQQQQPQQPTAAAWGATTAGQQQPQQPAQAPAQQPAAAAWGQATQQQPQQQQPAQQPAAWGQPAGQQPQQPQGGAGGWQQQPAANGGAAPWNQR